MSLNSTETVRKVPACVTHPGVTHPGVTHPGVTNLAPVEEEGVEQVEPGEAARGDGTEVTV